MANYKHSSLPLTSEDNYLLSPKGLGAKCVVLGELVTAKMLTMTVVATPHPA
jgi:hypothetical protein